MYEEDTDLTVAFYHWIEKHFRVGRLFEGEMCFTNALVCRRCPFYFVSASAEELKVHMALHNEFFDVLPARREDE